MCTGSPPAPPRAPPEVTSEGAALGLAWGSSRAGALYPSPGRGVAGAGTSARAPRPAPRPGSAEPRRLPASPGLSGAALQAAPPQAGAQSRSPHQRPKPPPQVRDGRGRRPAGAERPLPLSLRIPLIRGLSAAPRLRGLLGSARGGPGNSP